MYVYTGSVDSACCGALTLSAVQLSSSEIHFIDAPVSQSLVRPLLKRCKIPCTQQFGLTFFNWHCYTLANPLMNFDNGLGPWRAQSCVKAYTPFLVYLVPFWGSCRWPLKPSCRYPPSCNWTHSSNLSKGHDRERRPLVSLSTGDSAQRLSDFPRWCPACPEKLFPPWSRKF